MLCPPAVSLSALLQVRLRFLLIWFKQETGDFRRLLRSSRGGGGSVWWGEAFHEPENRPIDSQSLAVFRFMAREQFQKEQETTDKPAREDARPTKIFRLTHYPFLLSFEFQST